MRIFKFPLKISVTKQPKPKTSKEIKYDFTLIREGRVNGNQSQKRKYIWKKIYPCQVHEMTISHKVGSSKDQVPTKEKNDKGGKSFMT